ncbi:hypothetical protein HZH66_002083 [Vespula vulgaris]|uniref:Uncharacterized protein n=2 Tax=Vespula TaxID=7451 RepID=A0A834KKI3_VESVU|nr:hypothetical protein HZH66_002083 [Vespula vulgaris]
MMLVVVVVEVMVVEEEDEEEFSGVLRRAAMDRGWFVWFQNRRTKWRKKNAAEMATAKRRQEEVEGIVAEGEDGCSDAEADGSSETAAKRLRRELEQQYRH